MNYVTKPITEKTSSLYDYVKQCELLGFKNNKTLKDLTSKFFTTLHINFIDVANNLVINLSIILISRLSNPKTNKQANRLIIEMNEIKNTFPKTNSSGINP